MTRYVIKLPPFGPQSDHLARLRARANALLEQILARRPPDIFDTETAVCFGASGRWNVRDRDQVSRPRLKLKGDDDPDAEVVQMNEVAKDLEEVRVENPDDPEQYIITKRRRWSLFDAPDGIYRMLVWDNSDIDT